VKFRITASDAAAGLCRYCNIKGEEHPCRSKAIWCGVVSFVGRFDGIIKVPVGSRDVARLGVFILFLE